MKKLLIALILSILLSPLALADELKDTKDFSYGVSEDGCYYYSDTKEIVYSGDASLIGSANTCSKLKDMSSIWYTRKEIDKKQADRKLTTDKYWNRVFIMKMLRAK